jgi:hypothetical protein
MKQVGRGVEKTPGSRGRAETHMRTVINPTADVRVDLFGPTLEFLTSPQAANNEFSVLRGTIPPGCSVPLHSHPDTEDFRKHIHRSQAGEASEVLGGRRKGEFVLSSVWSSQTQTRQTKDSLEVRE